MNFLRHRIAALLCAACALATFSPSPSAAQDDEFSRLMNEGIRLFSEGKSDNASYLKAIEVFMRAKRINPIPDVTYNIARSYHLYGNCTQALAHYREYQSLAGSALEAKDVRNFISELAQVCDYGTLVLRCSPASATVSIDNGPPVQCNGTHAVLAGERSLVIATPSGRFVNRMANVVSGKTLDLEISIHEDGRISTSEVIVRSGAPLSERSMLWAGVATAGVGVALGLTGGILLGNSYKELGGGYHIESKKDGMYKAGWSLVGIGAGAAVTGVVLMIVDTVKNSGGDTVAERPIVPSVVFHDGGATAGVTFTF